MFKESIPFYEKVVEVRLKIDGHDSMNYGMALAMQSGAHRELGEFEKAESLLKDSFIAISGGYGEDCVAASMVLNSMGMLYKKMERFERAQDAYERALEIREQQLGDKHPDTMSTRHNIGELFLAMGEYEKAMEYLQHNVRTMEKMEEKEDL